MHTPLLRRLSGLALLLLTLVLMLGTFRAEATHLFGGEMSYRYLDANGPTGNEFRYEVSVFVYNNYGASSNVKDGRASVDVGFYLRDNSHIDLPLGMPSTNGAFVNGRRDLTIPKFSADTVTKRLPTACANGFTPPEVLLVKYVAVVCLPLTFDGYYCLFTEGARNSPLSNIQTSTGPQGGTGNMTLFMDMTEPILINSSPTFSDTAVALICVGDTTLILNSANDANGDRLTYSFGTPYAGQFNGPPGAFPQPLPPINYKAGYSTPNPLGVSGFAGLNANTGLSRYFTPTGGNFVVAVDVNEYRIVNGVEQLIGRTRRDVQLVARVCPAGSPPTLGYTPGNGGGSSGTGSRDFTIEEGQSLTFGINANTNPGGDPLDLKINSALLDGSGPINASFAGNQGVRAPGQGTGVVGVAGRGPLSGNFVFNSVCGQARTSSYDVLATSLVTCTSKSNSQVYRIFVTKTAPPTAIAGDNVICNPGVTRSYTAQGPTPPQGYRWRVSGGTITAGQGTGTLTVQWASTAGPRFVSLKNVSRFGCLSDSVSRAVDVRPVGTLVTTAASPVLCRGLATTLSVTSATAGLTYTWTAAGGPAGTGPTISVTPATTTTYTVTGTTADGVCNTQASVTVTVTSPPVADAGPNRPICLGGNTTLGTPRVAGLTYAWTPTTGLNDPALAQPTFTGNAVGATTLTLTVSSGPGCASTSAVTVTVNPAPTPDAGLDRAVCSGVATQLGTPGATGTTYRWRPTTGLDNPNIAQPTLTLATPGTFRYLVTASLPNASGVPCTADDSVFVTVNARPTLLVIAPVTLCAGGTANLAGDISQPIGLTYQWNPTTGLASPTSAVTTLTLTTPGTFAYTLTATNTATGCTNTTTAQVTVNPLPLASAGANQTLCANTATVGAAGNVGTVVFSASPAAGVSFSAPAGGLSTASFPVLAVPATYVVTATVTNPATACVNTATASITINPLPVANAGQARTVCALGRTTLGDGLPAAPGTTYAWTPTTGLSDPTSRNPTLTAPQQGQVPFVATYVLVATNAQGCQSTSSVAITVNPAAAVRAGIDKRTCSGVAVQIGAQPQVPNLTFAWTPTTGLTDPTASAPFLTLTNTTGANQVLQYIVTATTNLGCTATDTVLVTLNPAAVALPGPALTFCSGGGGQLGGTATPLPGATYQWSPTTGLTDPTALNTTVTGTNNTNAPVTTTYLLTVTNPAGLGGCTASASTTVTINPQPVAVAGIDRSFCAGGSATLGNGTGNVPGFSYAWTPTTGLSDPTSANPTVSLPNAGLTPLTTPYTLTVTSNTTPACVATGTVRVTVNPLPAVPATPLAFRACSGAAVTLAGLGNVTGATYLWTSATPGDLSSLTIPNPVATVTNATGGPLVRTYTLTITNPASLGGCAATTTVTLNVNPPLALPPTPARTACAGAPTQLGGNPVAGATYRWTPATGLNNPNIANPTLTLANNGPAPLVRTYQVRVSNANLGLTCADSASVTVTINPRGRPTTGPALTFCSGETRRLGDVPAANTNYLWTASAPIALAGLSDNTVANPTLTLTNATAAPITYTYTLTASTVLGGVSCDSAATVTVTVNPRGAAALPTPAFTVCSRQPQAIGRTGSANTNYQWTATPAQYLANLSSAAVANPTATLTNNGTVPFTVVYQLRATSTFAGASCPDSASVTVTVNPKGRPTTGPALAFCSGETRPLGAAQAANTTYLWTASAPAALAGLSSATIANPTVTLTNATAAPLVYTYTLTASTTFAGASCDSAATVTVTVNPAAVADAGIDKSICSGIPVGLGAGQPVAGTTYAWTPTVGLSNAAILTPTTTLLNLGAAPIVQQYVLLATTANGCFRRDTVNVTVNPAAVAAALPAGATPPVFCSGKTAQLGGGQFVAGSTYAWTPVNGLSNAAVFNPTVTLTNNTPAPITTRYRLLVTTALGCTDTASVRVTVNPAAIAQAGANATFCSGLNAQLGGSGPAVAGATYAWTPTQGLSNAAIFNPTVSLTNATAAPLTTRYRLLVTTALGCVDSSFVNVTVNPAAIAQAGTSATFCSGKTAQLGGNGPAIAGSVYAWTPVNGLSNAAVFNPTVTLTNNTPAPITTRYRLLVTTALGCTDTTSVRVTVNPAAIANAGANPAPLCSGSPATLGTGPRVTGATYQWTPATGLATPTAPTTAFSLINPTNAVITTRFRLLVTTALGCVDSSFVTVRVNPAAIANAGRDTTLCARKRVTLGTPAQPGYAYQWSPAAGLSNATAAQPVLTAANLGAVPVTTAYALLVTTPQGCPGRDTVRVTVNPRPAADSITGPASVCPTTPGLAYSIRTPRATAYQWLVSGGTLASGQGTPAITVDWGAAGTGFVKAFTLNALGCSSDTVTLPIRINTLLITATPNGPGNVNAPAPLPRSVCQADGPYTYSTIYANGSTYSWTIIGGTQASTNLSSVTVNWNPVTVPTIGRIVVTETSNPASGVRCLGGSDTLRVLVNPSPLGTLAISGPLAVCQGSGPVTFGLPGGFAGSTYAFTLAPSALPGTGTPLPATGSTATLATLPAPGSYVVRATETSVAGCAGPTFTLGFNVNPTAAPVAITGDEFVCDFTQTLQYSVPATPGGTYAWTATGGTIATGQGTSQVTVQFVPGAASYAVGVTPSTPFGCAGAAATKAVRFDRPGISLAVSSVALANNTSVVLTLAAPNSGNTPNAIQVLRRVAGTPTYVVVGTVPASATTFTDTNGVDATANSYEYQLSLTNGCRTTVTSIATQTVRLVATAAPGTGGRNQGSTALAWNPYVGFAVTEYRILRSNDGGPETLVTTVPAATLATTVPNGVPNSAQGAGFAQTFRVVAVGPNGLLSNSNTANTVFANPIVTYNVITPNNDGFNDVLVIDNIGLYPGNEFTVFNRWGREVYRTTNYRNDWGGDANTAPGNYYFLLKTADGNSRKGWFEVVK